MAASPEAVVRQFLTLWAHPEVVELRRMLAEDAVWVDGPNCVHRRADAIAAELARQLQTFPGQWVEIDTMVATGRTVMVEWHGGFTVGATPVETKVMAAFEVDDDRRITQMREVFDMKSLIDQLAAAGIRFSG